MKKPALRSPVMSESAREARRQRYWRRKAAGQCVGCGNAETGGYAKCKLCRMKFNRYQSTRSKTAYATLRAKGLCVGCEKNPSLPGRTRCGDCRVKQATGGRSIYRQRVNNGVCPRCESPLRDGYKWCQDCLSDQREIMRQSRLRGKEKKREQETIA